MTDHEQHRFLLMPTGVDGRRQGEIRVVTVAQKTGQYIECSCPGLDTARQPIKPPQGVVADVLISGFEDDVTQPQTIPLASDPEAHMALDFIE